MGIIDVHISPDGFKGLLQQARHAAIALGYLDKAFAEALSKQLEDSMNKPLNTHNLDFTLALDAFYIFRDSYGQFDFYKAPEFDGYDMEWIRNLSLSLLAALRDSGYEAFVLKLWREIDDRVTLSNSAYASSEALADATRAVFEALTAVSMIGEYRFKNVTLLNPDFWHYSDHQYDGMEPVGYSVKWPNQNGFVFCNHGFVPVWENEAFAIEGVHAARTSVMFGQRFDHTFKYLHGLEAQIVPVYATARYSFDLANEPRYQYQDQQITHMSQIKKHAWLIAKTVAGNVNMHVVDVTPSVIYFDGNLSIKSAYIKAAIKAGMLIERSGLTPNDQRISQLIRAGNAAKECKRYDVANACFVMAYGIATLHTTPLMHTKAKLVFESAPYDAPWYDLVHVRVLDHSLCLPWPLFDLPEHMVDHEGRLSLNPEVWPDEWPELVTEPRAIHNRDGVPAHIAPLVWQGIANQVKYILKDAIGSCSITQALRHFAAWNKKENCEFRGAIEHLLNHLDLVG